MPRDLTPPHDVIPFHPARNGTVDTFRWARRRLPITTLLEVDVTAARRAIRDYRRRTGEGLSFTAWVVACVARAVAEHPRVHALRQGRGRLVVFRDVDVAVLAERKVGSDTDAETLPVPFVIRDANRKALAEIHAEMRAGQVADVPSGAASVEGTAAARLQRVFFHLPAWLRDLLFWRPVLRSPARARGIMGTVVVTAVGMTTPGILAWGIPVAMHPLAVGIGGIARRSTDAGEAEILALAVVFDHAVVDGAPAGRFVRRLHQLLTTAHGLAEG